VDLRDALRTTGAVRDFEPRPVDDAVLYEILDDARFAPSGGNRQAWRVIVVGDSAQRRALRDLYLEGWHEYVAHRLEGLVPFSTGATPDERRRADVRVAEALALTGPDDFPARLDQAPALLAVTADLAQLAATDRDLGRYGVVGGASIYPFVWSILLAARDRGLGGVMTTVATRREGAAADLLGLPEGHALCALVALGYPRRRPTRLTRRPVEEFTTRDRLDGASFAP
jgi:nitroreductase